jgi:hypothetical protein
VTNVGVGVGVRYPKVPSGGGGGLWTPSQISTDIWLDFSDTSTITDSLGIVSKVNDKSGNANNVTQPAGASQPQTSIQTINGLNVITFDGTDDYFVSPIGLGDVFTAYFIGDTTTSGGRSPFWCEEVVSSTKNFTFSLSNTITYDQFPPSGGSASFGLSEGINVVSVNQQAANSRDVYDNGNLGASSVEAYSGSAPVTFSLGARLAGNNYFNSWIGEVVIALTDIPLADRQRIEGYLAWKWGPVALVALLPVSHPYKSAPPMV